MSKKSDYQHSLNFSPKNELKNFIESSKLKILSFKSGSEISNNKLIEGDGLDVLSSLKLGIGQDNDFKADIIMIDPPYNEGKSAGKYKDQWKGSGKNFDWAGESHGAYLDFLHPRLVMGKQVLSEEGIIMVFIGDREYHYVRTLMEQIYGEGNYIGTVIWDSNWSPTKNKIIHRKHEYVIMFSKNMNIFEKIGLSTQDISDTSSKSKLSKFAKNLIGKNFKEAESEYVNYYNQLKELGQLTGDAEQYKYIHPVSFEIFRPAGSNDPRKGTMIPLIHPTSGVETIFPGKGWRFSPKYLNGINAEESFFQLHDGKYCKVLQNDNSERVGGIIFGKDENTVPQTLYIHHESSNKKVLCTTGHKYDTVDKKEGINPKTGFETVKPTNFLVDLIQNYPNKNAVILDYFAGSGSTAVAVNEANKLDCGNRTWVLIEINQETIKEVLIPKLKYYGITNKDYKYLEVKECAINSKDLEKYFQKFLMSYLRSNNSLTIIEDSIHLDGIDVIGVNENNKSLVISNIQVPNQKLVPSKVVAEIERVLKETSAKKLDIYIIGDENFDAIWEQIPKMIVKNKSLSSKDIVLNKIPEKIMKEWESIITQLSGEQKE